MLPPAVEDTAHAESPYRRIPRLRVTDRGANGWWAAGSPVTVAWKQRGLGGSILAVEITRDGGRTFHELASSPANAGSLEVRAPREIGFGAIRMRDTATGRVTRWRRIEVTSPMRETVYGQVFAAALHEDGGVRVWGDLTAGRLGGQLFGTHGINHPARIDGFPPLASIHAGGEGYHLAAVDLEGRLWLWGALDLERYGRDQPYALLVPERVEGLADVLWARAGNSRTVARLRDGRLMGISHSGGSVVLDRRPQPHDQPIEIAELFGATDVQFGFNHGMALFPDGSVSTFGSNLQGALGDPSRVSGDGIHTVPTLTGIVAIGATQDGCIALRRDGAVFQWGYAPGPGDRNDFERARVPTRVVGLPPADEIALSVTHACALGADGVLYVWGGNGTGQLGDGTFEFRYPPVRSKQQDVARVFAGAGVTHVLTHDGRRLGWGNSGYGPLGAGNRNLGYLNAAVPINSR